MTNQTEWIPFAKRPPDIQQKVNQAYEQLADKSIYEDALDLYSEKDWGSLTEGSLYRGLLEGQRKKKILTAKEINNLRPPVPEKDEIEKGIQEDVDEVGIKVRTPKPDKEVQSLKWFRSNAPTTKIKEDSDDQYRIRLLDLYVSHVNETGETYFPRLEQMLRANAEFYGY